MKTDVLFINPGNQKKTYQGLASEFSGIDTPVWIMLVSDSLRRKGYSVAVYDTNTEGWDKEFTASVISKYNPVLIAVMCYGNHPSASTQTFPAAVEIIEHIKAADKNAPVVLCGTHPAALPEKTLNETPVDFIATGSGMLALCGLTDYLNGKTNIEKIPDLWYRKKDYGAFTFVSDKKINIENDFKGYAWDLLPDLKKYRAHNWHCFQYCEHSEKDDFTDVRVPYVSIYTSLGCPYNCSYCCINAIYGKPGITYWPIEMVAKWIDELVLKYSVKNIRFADELFILSPQRVEKFCDLMIERKYNLNIWLYGRVDTISGKLLNKLKLAGVNWIALGIESANKKVISSVNKNIRADIRQVVSMIKDAGINIIGNYMFGLPEDNTETMRETYDLAVELNCEFANFYSVMAYPGSEFYNEALKNPDILPDSWNGYSQHSYETRPLPTKFLSAAEVLRFRDKIFIDYFSNQKYIDMVGAKFGNKIIQHLKRMLEIKLKRKILDEQ